MPTSPSPATRTVFTRGSSPEVGALQLAPPTAGRRHRALAADLHDDATPPPRWRRRARHAGRPSCVGESNDGGPHGPEGVAESARPACGARSRARSKPPARRKYSATISQCSSSEDVQPAADRLGREAAVRERAHERAARTHARAPRRRTPRPAARGSRPTRSTPRRRTSRRRTAARGSALRSCTTRAWRLRVGGELVGVHAEHGEPARRARRSATPTSS